jgi:hypothetical protein
MELQAQQRQAQEEAQKHAQYQQQLLQWQAHQTSMVSKQAKDYA